MRCAKLQHHDGDDDSDNAITERFYSAGAHRLFFLADGKEALGRAHVHYSV